MNRRAISTPVDASVVATLSVGDVLEIYGTIYTGRDAVLPRLVAELEARTWCGPSLSGAVVFHTGVSGAGVGPTTSNKREIEGSIPALCAHGVRIHLGKGMLTPETVEELRTYGAIFAVTMPTSALFRDRVKRQELVAYAEEGMEAMYALKVEAFPAVIAIAHGRTMWRKT